MSPWRACWRSSASTAVVVVAVVVAITPVGLDPRVGGTGRSVALYWAKEDSLNEQHPLRPQMSEEPLPERSDLHGI